jgi:putative aldouronate transport system substrate-binding protein
MNMKKMAYAAAIAALTVSVAACGSDTTGKTSPSPSGGGQSASVKPSEAPKKFTVTMLDYRYAGSVPPTNGRGIEMINQKFNIDYKPQFVIVTDYLQKLSATVASGELPDIITLNTHQDPQYLKWAKQGAFLPLNDVLDKYESFKLIPENVRKAVTIDGKIYGLPAYFPLNYQLSPMIRQDWLDNLGLKMPTSYEELKDAAISFTTKDPDKNGKNDTYGLAMSQYINPPFGMGAYWDFLTWYHKDREGNYIPGIVSEARKEQIAWLADLYKQGAATPDFAVMNWGQTNKEFYGGKAGIFIGGPRGMSDTFAQGLVDVAPGAKLVPVPPFKAPDGSQGFTAHQGFYGITLFNAKLAKEPEKLKRILEMHDLSRKFYPIEQQNAGNKDFDWITGNEGQGYKVENGTVKKESAEKGLKPSDYLPNAVPWAPSDEANAYSKMYKVPVLADLAAKYEKMHVDTKHYFNPVNAVFSETRLTKEDELTMYMYEEQTKMIYGQRPISDWDNLVKEWKNKGGAQMIKEVNDALKAANVKGEWK